MARVNGEGCNQGYWDMGKGRWKGYDGIGRGEAKMEGEAVDGRKRESKIG